MFQPANIAGNIETNSGDYEDIPFDIINPVNSGLPENHQQSALDPDIITIYRTDDLSHLMQGGEYAEIPEIGAYEQIQESHIQDYPPDSFTPEQFRENAHRLKIMGPSSSPKASVNAEQGEWNDITGPEERDQPRINPTTHAIPQATELEQTSLYHNDNTFKANETSPTITYQNNDLVINGREPIQTRVYHNIANTNETSQTRTYQNSYPKPEGREQVQTIVYGDISTERVTPQSRTYQNSDFTPFRGQAVQTRVHNDNISNTNETSQTRTHQNDDLTDVPMQLDHTGMNQNDEADLKQPRESGEYTQLVDRQAPNAYNQTYERVQREAPEYLTLLES